MVEPIDLMPRIVAAYVGVPYRLHGRDPAGWDCRGCVDYLRRVIFNKVGPSLDGDVPIEATASAARIAEVMEAQVRERLSAWTPCAARPGAVVLLEVFGRPAHVGLMLTPRDFIHAMAGCETVISRLDEPRWSNRVRGVFDGV